MKLLTPLLLENKIAMYYGETYRKVEDEEDIAKIISLLAQLDLLIINLENEVRHSKDLEADKGLSEISSL